MVCVCIVVGGFFGNRREASGISEFSRKKDKEWRKKQIPKIHLKNLRDLPLPPHLCGQFLSVIRRQATKSREVALRSFGGDLDCKRNAEAGSARRKRRRGL